MSWMADLLPGDRSGHFWGIRQRLLSASLVITAAIFGKLLDAFPSSAGLTGFSIVFALAALGGVGDIAIHGWVHEPRLVPHPRTEPVWGRIVAPLRDAGFRRLTWGLGAYSCAISMPGFSNGLPGFFNVVYLKESCGATYTQASLLLIASSIGGIVWTPWIGRLIDRHGARRVIVRLMLVGSTTTLTWFFVGPARIHFSVPFLGPQTIPQAVLLMSAASLVIGGFYSGVLLCQLRLSQMHTPSEGRTVPMAVHWSLVGLMASIGPMIAGLIKDHFPAAWNQHLLPSGTPFSYFQVIILLQMLIISLVAVPLLRRER
jgi:MFS family permease